MLRFKNILRRIFCLPPFLTILISIPSFAAVIYVLAAEREESAFTYIAYVASAYALIIVTTAIPRISQSVRRMIDSSPLIGKIRYSPLGEKASDAMFRTKLSLYTGVMINSLYIALNLVSGIRYRSFWFGSLAVYYIMLASMRFLLLRHANKDTIGKDIIKELRRYRLCGIVLLLMNNALAGIVILVVCDNNGFEYQGLLIYVMAMYVFYITITSIVNLVKYRKYGSPVMSAAKVLNLTAALVSMLSLETAMLTQFDSGNDPVLRQIMTGISGFAVCLIVLGMAVIMIVRSTKQLKQLESSR